VSEDNTHRTRQIFYALRVQELVSTLALLAHDLDANVLDESAIGSLKAGIDCCERDARELVRSTYKLLD
jgi:hypothetical protein